MVSHKSFLPLLQLISSMASTQMINLRMETGICEDSSKIGWVKKIFTRVLLVFRIEYLHIYRSLKFDVAVEKPESFEGVMVAVPRLVVSHNSIIVIRCFPIYKIYTPKMAKVSMRGRENSLRTSRLFGENLNKMRRGECFLSRRVTLTR